MITPCSIKFSLFYTARYQKLAAEGKGWNNLSAASLVAFKKIFYVFYVTKFKNVFIHN